MHSLKKTRNAKTKSWLQRREVLARILAWIGLLLIVVLSVVPAAERPVTEFSPNLSTLQRLRSLVEPLPSATTYHGDGLCF